MIMSSRGRFVPVQFDPATLAIDHVRAGVVAEMVEFIVSVAPAGFTVSDHERGLIRGAVNDALTSGADLYGAAIIRCGAGPEQVSGMDVKRVRILAVHPMRSGDLSISWVDRCRVISPNGTLEAEFGIPSAAERTIAPWIRGLNDPM